MTRVRSFFLREAGECLEVLRNEVDSEAMDVAAMYDAARRFRGSAQMARFGALAETAGALEKRLRPADGAGPRDELRTEADRVLELLESGIAAVREGRLEEDPRMEAGMEEQDAGEAGGADGADTMDTVETVPIETLEYRGRRALEEALSLREPLEDTLVSGAPAGPILDELFDLIRLGAK